MIRLGVVDFDTSHVVEFTKRFNHKDVAKDQWVEGATVVVGCPGESKIMPERIGGYKKKMTELGVKLVDKPADMIGQVDGMLIESQEGGVHYERAKPFLDKGIPCFIDKPFTCSLTDAKKIAALAKKKKVPVFSASSLRYAPDVVNFVAGVPAKHGKLLGAMAYGTAPYHQSKDKTPRNPGLYHYGIHVLEILYALMGPGCQRLTCSYEKKAEVVTGQWKDGRLAGLRGIRAGRADYGFVAFGEKAIVNVKIDTKYIYRELLKQVVKFFKDKKSPVDLAETVEMMAFIDAAMKSGANHGAGEKLGT